MIVSFGPDARYVSLGARPFTGCDLGSIAFPPFSERIGDKCFKDCKYLEPVSFSTRPRVVCL